MHKGCAGLQVARRQAARQVEHSWLFLGGVGGSAHTSPKCGKYIPGVADMADLPLWLTFGNIINVTDRDEDDVIVIDSQGLSVIVLD